MSGRNHAEQLDGADEAKPSSLAMYSASAGGDGDGTESAEAVAAAAAEAAAAAAASETEKAENAIPPLREAAEDAVEMEWWDEAFLTKEMRDDKVMGARCSRSPPSCCKP